ncbi:MAG TPA: hypothetical protein VGN63_10860 [Flavisolibacter sp.]|nr:hypothetical protein [Flavisolibacter sp.]
MKSFLLTLLLFASFTVLHATPPTLVSKNLTLSSIEGNGFQIGFTKGDGQNRIIVIRKETPVTFVPANGATYTASNTTFDNSNLVAAGEYVVYNGASNGVTVSGLPKGTTYHIAIYEYNGSGTATEYLATPLVGSVTTAAAPTTGASNLQFERVTGHSFDVSFLKGSGSGRLVIMKKEGPVTAAPTDLSHYWPGTDLGNGNIVVYNNSGNAFSQFNLPTETTYHFAIFEYNGANKPVYQSMAPTRGQVTTNERPTVASKNLVLDSRDGDRLTIRYSLGNGKARIIIARQGQPVTALPVDGTTYKASNIFGDPGSSHLGDGQYVVYDNSYRNESGGHAFELHSLPRNTNYHFAIFEYDLDSDNKPVYLTTDFPAVNGTTYDEPTLQAKNLLIQNITDKGANLSFTAGNGTGRIVVGRRGAPVEVTPADLTNYAGSTNFGAGTAINGDHYVISDGLTSATVGRLQSSTAYYFAVYEYNGYMGKLYLDASPARGELVTAIRPTIAASNMMFSNVEGNSLKISWFNGNGRARILVARKGSAVTAISGATGDVKDNSVYSASTVFGNGAEVKPGEFVIYNDSVGTVGTANSVTLSGLEPNTTYHFAVYEYGQLSGSLQYATATPANSATLLLGSSSTAKPPTAASKSITFSGVTNRTMNLSWIQGNGAMRVVLAKAGSPVDAKPVDLTDYVQGTVYGEGTQVGNNNFVVYKGTGASVNLTGLQPGVTYHFAIYEANGSGAPVFQNTDVTPAYTASKATLEKPTVAASGITFSNESAIGFTINWKRGNGGKCLVVMKKGGNVNTRPVDGVVYAANNVFGSGEDIAADGSKEYVVYNGTGNSVAVTGLEPGGFYYVYVFEYEEPLTVGTAYLTASYANSSKQVVAAPLTQAADIKIVSSLSGSVTLEWINGSGQKRILLAKEGAAVDAVPANGALYNPSSSFGLGQQIGAGNFVVYANSGNTTTVSNLKPNKTYHFALFEYNQFNSSALYLTADPTRIATILASPLPVSWISFTGVRKGGDVLLAWKTAAEIDNRWFEVERSADGISFSRIGVVHANTAKSYEFLDKQVENGMLHYRLKQVDNDGGFSYSKIIQVKMNTEGDVKLLQNPVSNNLHLSCSTGLMGGSLFIMDAAGKVVYTGTVTSQQVSVPVHGLPAGTYFARVVPRNGLQPVTLRFVHQ